VSTTAPLRPAVFLDRDGVLNRDSDDFIKTPDELELLPGAAEAVARLNAAGFLCVVITNQSGIARGLFAEDALIGLHAKLRAELAAGGGTLDAIYYCPHGPDDGCDCRKPATGMLLRAATDHGIDLAASWVVGDRPGDITCGAAVGARTILVLTGKLSAYDPARFASQPDFVCANVLAAAQLIIDLIPESAP
jgi:histidinol-phosphate phosphatase family protein